jgi:hypothetical protein
MLPGALESSLDTQEMVFAPEGLQDLARRFNAGNTQGKEFALKGREIGVVTRVEYCMVSPFFWRPCRARRRNGEITGVKTPG